MSLSRIEVITGMSKFSSLKAALSKAGVRGMTVMQVLGCGVEKGTREYEVDELEEMELLPKQQINIVVETEREFHRRDHQGTAVYRSHWRWKDLYL